MSTIDKTKLTPELITRLRQDQRALHDILQEFDKFEECGGDCTEYRNVHQKTAVQIEKLLQYYS